MSICAFSSVVLYTFSLTLVFLLKYSVLGLVRSTPYVSIRFWIPHVTTPFVTIFNVSEVLDHPLRIV